MEMLSWLCDQDYYSEY